jgi:glycosyltransferase involved in cell wall biosynthesis
MTELTLIVPFYRNNSMVERQIQEWNLYPKSIQVILVDDGSPEPALPHVEALACADLREHLQVYRIGIDLAWNRSGARNLGAHVATTEWILQIDIDHLLPAEIVGNLLNFTPDPKRWYRFPRWRVGRADDTRKKDKIPKDQEYGEIHPHVDSYLVRRDIYWDKVGGYNEDFSGAIGGGNAFLHRLESIQRVELLPTPIRLEVYTRDKIKDASDWSLPRDKTEYKKRRLAVMEKGNPKPKNPLRFPWTREL